MMRSSSLFLLWCLSVLEIVPKLGSGLNVREVPIRLRILEFDSQSDRLVQVLTSLDSDLVVGEGSVLSNRFVLECKSVSGPVAFTYRGDGIPEYRTNANITRSRQGSKIYWTFLTFSRFPQAPDTGNYTCQSMNNPNLSNSVYLYVPGSTQAVFVPSDSADRLDFSRSVGSFRIPCSVVHPDATVSLERIVDRTARSEHHGKVTFSPKSGFIVPTSMVSPGSSARFVCRGSYNGRVEESSYLLFSDAPILSTPNTPTDIQDEGIPNFSAGLTSSCTKSFCGSNAECIVIDYNPHCVCYEDYTGDPKTGCTKLNEYSGKLTVRDQCIPSACGKFSQCLTVNGHPVCSCLENYYGVPPRCKPHREPLCSTSNDCEWEQYCNQHTRMCESVCKGSVNFCAINTRCLVINHTPFCECLTGFSGNPYIIKESTGCTQQVVDRKQKSCVPSSCGLNAFCKVHPSFPTTLCFCPEGYTGDASTVCFKFRSPENITAPVRQPLIPKRLCHRTTCGVDALCGVRNNTIQCFCPSGFRGDPWKKCTPISRDSEVDNAKICNICGPNTICKIARNRDKILCECAPEATGNPPNCRRMRKDSCRDDFDCPEERFCDRGNKCMDPCPRSCSETAICEAFNHTAKCSCPQGLEGDPRFSCKKPDLEIRNHPCRTNCGPNTVCRAVPFQELQKYRDTLRASRQDALYFDMVKANGKLRDGMFSECFCRSGYDGNPYSIAGCQPQIEEESEYPATIVIQPEPCKPHSPCGSNAVCRGFNGKAYCSCDRISTGHPPNCRLRCQSDKDCLFNETCINKICEDP